MVPGNVWMLLGGLAILGLLKLLRNHFRGWTQDETNFFTVGYFFPLLGISLVLLGIGGFRGDRRYLPPSPLDITLDVTLMVGLAFVLLAVATIFGLRMPSILLPRWARTKAGRDAAQVAIPDNPELLLTDHARTVDLTVPGFSDDWISPRSRPHGPLVTAKARTALPSGYHPTVTVTRYELGSLDLTTWTTVSPDTTPAEQTPVTFAGRPAIHTTTRRTVDGRELTTWTWATTDDGEGLRLAITCATADAPDYATTAADIAASLTWKDGNDPITGRPRRGH
nr:hypothetical protein [Propionicimonas sp.]